MTLDDAIRNHDERMKRWDLHESGQCCEPIQTLKISIQRYRGGSFKTKNSFIEKYISWMCRVLDKISKFKKM